MVPVLRDEGLYLKLQELCGWDAVTVRCQLPTEDMDALVTVTGDGDFASVQDEYDARQGTPQQQLRIRVFLFRRSPAAGRSTPRAPAALLLMTSRRRTGHRLMHAAYRGVSHSPRFTVVMTPLAARSPPVRPELFCQCR